MSRPPRLSAHCSSQLCTGLGRALDAGLDAVSALRAVGDVCGGALQSPLRHCASAVGKGRALSVSLERQGLLCGLDHALVSAGEAAGTLAPVLLHLGERHERAHARWRKVKGRLMLPAFTLLLALLALPAPALFAGRIGLGHYLGTTLAMIALVLTGAALLRAAAERWRARGPPRVLTRSARAVPLLRRLCVLHERAQVSDALAIGLGAGIPAFQAVDQLVQAQPDGVRRQHLVRVRSLLESGVPLADALADAGLLDRDGGFALVSSGEQAGRLAPSLMHHSRGLNHALDEVYDLVARWIPVVAYAAVVGVVAAGLLG